MKRFVCEKCGSSEIEVRAWVKPYENNRFSSYCHELTRDKSNDK